MSHINTETARSYSGQHGRGVNIVKDVIMEEEWKSERARDQLRMNQCRLEDFALRPAGRPTKITTVQSSFEPL